MTIIKTNGILFDLDGTLVDSTVPVEKFWQEFADQHGIDYNEIISQSHGRRTIDNLKLFTPEIATDEYVQILEPSIPAKWGQLASEIESSSRFLDSLPIGSWGVVTSGTYGLASGWLERVLKRTPPKVFITAEDVSEGKPDPSGYLKGKKLLGITGEDSSFIVFEDAKAGVNAAKRAGAKYVIGLATTHSRDVVESFNPDFIINDYSDVKLVAYDDDTKTLTLEIKDKVA